MYSIIIAFKTINGIIVSFPLLKFKHANILIYLFLYFLTQGYLKTLLDYVLQLLNHLFSYSAFSHLTKIVYLHF